MVYIFRYLILIISFVVFLEVTHIRDQKCHLAFSYFLFNSSKKFLGRSVLSHSLIFPPNPTRKRPSSMGMGRVPTALTHRWGPNIWDPNKINFIWNKIFQINFQKSWKIHQLGLHRSFPPKVDKIFAQLFWVHTVPDMDPKINSKQLNLHFKVGNISFPHQIKIIKMA